MQIIFFLFISPMVMFLNRDRIFVSVSIPPLVYWRNRNISIATDFVISLGILVPIEFQYDNMALEIKRLPTLLPNKDVQSESE